jgi:vacuolar-type H+-ATPase subunit I/STV1
MLIFLPLFFGMMLGDVVYGVILIAVAWFVRGRAGETGFVHDLSGC